MKISEVRSRYQEGVRPAELVAEIWQKIEAWNDPSLFIHLSSEEAVIAEAENLGPEDGRPLWGVPFVVKDNIDVAGWPTTAGCPDFLRIAEEDATVVRRLRDAGAIVIGKVNLDQFATGLVGTRSPYGVARNAVAPGWLPGGSSSGSASAVAAGLCCFSLGTDTAGSGRVPAAFQELIGWKPSRGLVSTHGVLPACRSLDCVTVFANDVADVARVMDVVAHFDERDPCSRRIDFMDGVGPRMGIPKTLDFAGDPDTPGLYAGAVARAEAMGAKAVPVELDLFLEAARLLYEGPWVAERWAAVGDFVEQHAESVFPVTRRILEASREWDAVSAFRAQDRLREIARAVETVWEEVDFLLLPTTPRLYRVEEVEAEPYGTNATLGRYTNFMNLLDLAAVAVPAGRARGGKVPWGVTLAAPAGKDLGLLEWGAKISGENPPAMGAHGNRVEVIVCGAHLEGMPLNGQLSSRGGRKVWEGLTSSCYRMFAMPAASNFPARPALVRDDLHGAAIAVESWSLSRAAFGDFVASIPAPLGIGKIALSDGRELPGFIAEPRALEGAEEITAFGGWRAWVGK